MFKGGTSLSKVFGVIDRFSEDIDLCLAPEFVGADEAGFDALKSRVKRDATVLEMQRLCANKVQRVVLPLLEGAIVLALGSAPAGQWLHCLLDADAKSPMLFFRFPSTRMDGFLYMRREVKLEFGTLTDQQPTGRYPIQALVAMALWLIQRDGALAQLAAPELDLGAIELDIRQAQAQGLARAQAAAPRYVGSLKLVAAPAYDVLPIHSGQGYHEFICGTQGRDSTLDNAMSECDAFA